MPMASERWQSIKEVFLEAESMAPHEREAFLDRACAGDRALRAEIESLLASGETTEGWLDGAVFEVAADWLADEAETAGPDARIGPYRIERELGRGGMGAVYLASRDDTQFEQRVAIKLVRRGMESEEIARRFRQERQILASLEHPNIARLYDGGVAASGAPYLIMEYIEGEPIDAYCLRRGTSVGDRLDLFRKVCSAVHYAHRHLVVHRDLKPSNILVTDDGSPKLLDFGIAKLLGHEHVPRLSGATLPGLGLLTPEYASPEHVRGERITTASDVYSLGVLLYQLIAGRPPYRLSGRSPAEVERVVAETPPPAPSSVVGDQTDGGRSLRRRLAGDLDVIVQKALHKDPSRRYRSADQLSEDLRRHRVGLPVIARPDTWTYRFGKFVRRHSVASVAAALVTASLVAGIFATTWQAREARAQRRRAEAQETATAQVAEFLADLFVEANPFGKQGDTPTVRELLDRGAERIETELADQPVAQARMMDTIGLSYQSLGLFEDARRLLAGALERRRAAFGEDAPEVAESLNHLGSLLMEMGETGDAESHLRAALATARSSRGERSLEVADALKDLGALLRIQGRYEEAEPVVRDALALRRELAGEPSQEVAESLNSLALLLRETGNYSEAESHYRAARGRLEALYGPRSLEVAILEHNLSELLRGAGRHAEAEASLSRSMAVQRELLGDAHPNIAVGLNTLALLRKHQGDLEGAEEAYREALRLRRELLGDGHPAVARVRFNLGALLVLRRSHGEAETVLLAALAELRQAFDGGHPDLATTLHHLGRLRLATGRFERAEDRIRQALAMRRELLGDRHPAVATSLLALGETLMARGRADEAEPLLRTALAIRAERRGAGHWQTAEARSVLGSLLASSDRRAEAEALLREGYRDLERSGVVVPLREAAARLAAFDATRDGG